MHDGREIIKVPADCRSLARRCKITGDEWSLVRPVEGGYVPGPEPLRTDFLASGEINAEYACPGCGEKFVAVWESREPAPAASAEWPSLGDTYDYLREQVAQVFKLPEYMLFGWRPGVSAVGSGWGGYVPPGAVLGDDDDTEEDVVTVASYGEDLIECPGCDGKGHYTDINAPGWPSVECEQCGGEGEVRSTKNTAETGRTKARPKRRINLNACPDTLPPRLRSLNVYVHEPSTVSGYGSYGPLYTVVRAGWTLTEAIEAALDKHHRFDEGTYRVDALDFSAKRVILTKTL